MQSKCDLHNANHYIRSFRIWFPEGIKPAQMFLHVAQKIMRVNQCQ